MPVKLVLDRAKIGNAQNCELYHFFIAFLSTIAERATEIYDEERGSAHSGQIRINRDEFLLTDILFWHVIILDSNSLFANYDSTVSSAVF